MSESIPLVSIGFDKDGVEVFAPALPPKPQSTENNAFKLGFKLAFATFFGA